MGGKANPLYKTPTYNSWDNMRRRCFSPSHASYPDYGGRGITVQPSWILPSGEGFRNFLADLGVCPAGYSLDREDVNGDYTSTNCRWVENSLQAYNKRKARKNKSGKSGVWWNDTRGQWEAFISVASKKINLGRHFSYESAVMAREKAELEYYGFTKE